MFNQTCKDSVFRQKAIIRIILRKNRIAKANIVLKQEKTGCCVKVAERKNQEAKVKRQSEYNNQSSSSFSNSPSRHSS